MRFFIFVIFCSIILNLNKASVSSKDVSTQREDRLFGIFNVVTFKNDQCTAKSDSTLFGTCMSSSDCSSGGGSTDGSCAAGFGVCCMFTKTCDTSTKTTVDKDCTYIQSPNYPQSASASTTCAFTFSRIRDGLCQIRLDYKNAVTLGPSNYAACGTANDKITVTSPTGISPPEVCGTLTGQHMYMETGSTGDAGSLTVAFGTGTATTRTFKIKVTYIDCTDTDKAPTDCTQYFTDAAGSFQSYNFAGGQMLQAQHYATCIKQLEGFCSVNYKQSDTTTPNPFQLLNAGGNPPVATTTTSVVTSCSATYVLIPPSSSSTDGKHCGAFLNEVSGQTTSGAVESDVKPFRVTTFSNSNTLAGIAITGYNIDYMQVPCV